MRLAYFWINRVPVINTVEMSGHGSEAVCAFRRHFQHLVASAILPVDSLIGGDGVVVEIDESKLGKRKYNRGHHVEGIWVVGGIERTPEKRIFIVPVQDRCAETLEKIIRAHVRPNSIIYTDCWKGYSRVSNEYAHATVNHSKHFVDPSTGVHTNTIEGFWNGLKQQIPPRARVETGMVDKLMEVIWRRQNKGKTWGAFLQALRDIHYDFIQ
jgi:transposase-like protein